MNNLNETKRRQDDLSTYIKRQLSTLLKQVQQTPPKKSSSLKKIQRIVDKSNIPNSNKKQIHKEIKRVQSAIDRSKSVQTMKLKLKNEAKTSNKYEKNLFYENMVLEQKQLNMNKKILSNQVQTSPNKTRPQQFLNLVQTFQDLRSQRLKYEHEIQSLSIKAQKLQRLIGLKLQNQQKYIQSTVISRKYQEKKQTLQSLKSEIKNAAKQNRKKLVSVLMKKYSQVQQG